MAFSKGVLNARRLQTPCILKPDAPVQMAIHTKLARGAVLLLATGMLASLASAGERPQGSDKLGRRLQQSARAIVLTDPVSATPADLVDDPTGRGHLLVRRRSL